MGTNPCCYTPQDVLDLHSFAEQYQKNILFLNQEIPRGTIPYVIHFVWLGPKPFPNKSIQNVLSWKNHHPDWRFILWTDSKERNPPIPEMEIRLVQERDFGLLQHLIETSTNWGEKADMIRYSVLYQEGGVYADHDVWCEKSVAPLIETFDFVVGCDPLQEHPGIDSDLITNTSTIMSRPGHPILQATIAEIANGWELASQKVTGTDKLSNLTRTMLRTVAPFVSKVKGGTNLEGNRDIVLPSIYLYSNEVFPEDVYESLLLKGYVFAIHKHNVK